ncbi:hypothetical protein N0V90_009773 [Kalmusia sp. IMI 367209]|nr:hypothetical protein N0V90_009773 [Kalmusia sp. IMI 367209]
MDDQYWDTILTRLDEHQLHQLRQKIDQLLTQYSFQRDSEDHVSSDLARATYYSNSSTLYQSGRSTPQASSITSDKPNSLPPRASYGDNVPSLAPYATEAHLWPPFSATNTRSQLVSSLLQEATHKPLDICKPGEAAPKQFFCTFCAEVGKYKVIKTKQDWKRHEEDYHIETGLQWICQVKDCSEVFFHGSGFKQHLRKDHEGKKLPRDSKEVRQLSRVYACGFENCRELNKTWKDHCDHVATHMLKGHTTWTYDRTIRNLLKDPRLSNQWKNIYGTLCPQLEIIPNDLTWDPQSTRRMREQLEFHNFEGHSIEDFLQRLFLVGIPHTKAKDFAFRLSHSNLASPSSYTIPSLPLQTLAPSAELFNFDSTLGDVNAPSETINASGTEAPVPLNDNRYSINMTDAPPLYDSNPFNMSPIDPLGEIPSAEDELLTIEAFITETAPYDDAHLGTQGPDSTVPDNSKSHSPRALMVKSKEWLAAKKSQHLQPIVIEHPDIPTNMRLPASSHRKRTHTAAHTTAPFRMHSDQS